MRNILLGPKFDLLPKELTAFKQWVLFRFERRGDKIAKVPYQPNGQKASTVDPSHWSSFDSVVFAYDFIGGFDGIGFVFSPDDPYCGIDIDGCVNVETQEIEPRALKWLKEFSSSYIEYSPSGKGLHIIIKGKLPDKGKHKSPFEVYDQGRYFTFTGNKFNLGSSDVRDCQTLLNRFLAEEFDSAIEKNSTSLSLAPLTGQLLNKDDIGTLIKKSTEAKNGAKFKLLFDGKWEEAGYPSRSNADQALCSMLAFCTKNNELAIDQIFRESGLYREKWDRKGDPYNIRTIRAAIRFREKASATEFDATAKTPDDDSPLPIIHISKIEPRDTHYQIQDILIENSVGFISAQPGTCKTWLSWEIGLSIASGTKAFGKFQAKKGKVIAFNAEDDPSTITRQRLKGLAASKGISLEDADFHLFETHSLSLDDPKTQQRIKLAIELHRPSLVILDPFRNLHTKDENDASEISPILDFLRGLNRDYRCSILLVCHDRKSSKGDSSRRQSQTRGSNALEGWRDTAIYMDEVPGQKGIYTVTIYHRGAQSPPPFIFRLDVTSSEDKKTIEKACLTIVNPEDIAFQKSLSFEEEVKKILKSGGEMNRAQLIKKVARNKRRTLSIIKSMIGSGQLKEIKKPGQKAKVLVLRTAEN